MASVASTYRGPPLPPLLVGREQELDKLRDAFQRAVGGHGGLVLVSGEAGIGKTSLIQALMREARQHGALVLEGAAYDLTVTPPYGPWLEITDRYPDEPDLPELPEILKRGAGVGNMKSQPDLFAFVRAFFLHVSKSRPQLLVLEDLHWADQASLDLLRYLARNVEGERVLIVGSYRHDEISRDHPLFQLLPVLVRESKPVRIDLRPLTTNEIVELVNLRYSIPSVTAARLARYLSLRSEGNPLFLLEMLRAIEAERVLNSEDPERIIHELDHFPLPPLIRQVIEARVSRLEPNTIDLLQAAAVVGESVPIDLWQQVSQTDETRLSNAVLQATEAHLILENNHAEAVQFTHALIREVLYERIPLPRKRSLHRTTGASLLARPRGDTDAIAWHFQQGGDSRAVEWLVRAGMRAREQSAWISAADRFASAAELLAGDDTQSRARGWLFFYAGYLLRFTTGSKPIEYHQKAEQAAVAAGDELLAAYALYSRGSTRAIQPTPEMRPGLVELRQGVQAIEHLSGNHRWRSTDEQAQVMIQRLLLEPDSDAHLELESAQRLKDPITVPQKGVVISRLAQAGHFLESLEMGEAFVSRLDSEFGDAWRMNIPCIDAFSGLANDYAAIGNPDAARHALSTARSAFLSIGDHAMVEFMTWVELNMVVIPYRTDHLDERADLGSLASLEWERCREITVSGGSTEAPARLIIHELEGHWHQAWAMADDQERSHPWKAYVAQAMLIKGRLSHYQGNPESAWTFVNKLLLEGPSTEPGNCYFLTTYDAIALAANLCLEAGDLDRAREWLAARDRWLEWSGAHLWKAENFLLWAHYYQATGSPENAHDYAAEALATASNPRQPLMQLRIRRFLGQISTSQKRHDDAAHFLDEALTLADACGAPYERALTLLALAEHHVATGKHEKVSACIRDVRSICEPIDARSALQWANALERKVSARSAGTPRHTTLTAREVDVLRRIAQGRSNREIAEELFLSTRTIERHVANIYTKIHVHNRVEATAYALQHELT